MYKVYLFKFTKKNVCFLPSCFLVFFFFPLSSSSCLGCAVWKVKTFFFFGFTMKKFSQGKWNFYTFSTFPLITELKFLRNFFHLLILFSLGKTKFGSGRKRKHFTLFTLEVDKRIFDVYVFIQFGVLLMWLWLWCGIQFFKGNDTIKRAYESFLGGWKGKKNGTVWTQFTRINLIRIQVHLTLLMFWRFFPFLSMTFQVEAMGIPKLLSVVTENS